MLKALEAEYRALSAQKEDDGIVSFLVANNTHAAFIASIARQDGSGNWLYDISQRFAEQMGSSFRIISRLCKPKKSVRDYLQENSESEESIVA